MEKSDRYLEKDFMDEINILISNEKYISDIKNNIANDEYLTKVHSLMKNYLDKGYEYQKMHEYLSTYMLKLREQNKEDEEDLILEAITFLDGWCAPEKSLEKYK